MFPVKIVGFMPAIGGCTVMMPSDVIEMSGTDFDIDKLFFMLKEIRRETHNSKLRTAFTKWLQERHGLDSNAFEKWINENSTIDIFSNVDEDNKKALEVAKNLLKKIGQGVTEEEIASAEKESMIFTYFMSEKGFEFKHDNPVYNILRPKPVLDEKGEIDIWRTIDEAKKAEVDNMLIDSIFDVLTSPEGSQLMMRQGTFRNIKETSRVRRIMKDKNALEAFIHQYSSLIREKGIYGAFQYILENGVIINGKHINGFTVLDDFYEQYATIRNPQDVLYEVDIFRNLMDGNDLIGMFAVNSSSHYKLQFYNVNLKVPIYINGQEIIEIDPVYSPINGKRTGEICAQFQAASPDNGKDPCLGDLNISPETVNIVSLLSRLGLDILDIGAIVDSENILDYEIEDLSIEDIGNLKKDINKFNLNISKLEELKAAILLEDKTTLNDPENQLFILSFKLWYSYIRKVAKDLSSISPVIRSDSPNGALSSDYTTAIQQILAIKALKDNLKDGNFTINGLDALVDFELDATKMSKEELMKEFSENPIGRLQATFTLGIMSAPNIVNSVLSDFSDASFKRFDDFIEETGIALHMKKNAGIIKYLLTEFNMFLMTREGLFNSTKEGQTVMDKRNYYIHDFPIQYKKLKSEKNEDGTLKYERIFSLPSMMRLSNKNDKGLKMDNIGKISPETRKWYTESFDSLLNLKSPNEEENEMAAKLAVDLLMYGFFDNGLNFKHNSFSIFFSSTYIKSIPGLVDLLREVENLTSKSNPVIDNRFLEQFLINHPDCITKITGKNGVRKGDYLYPISNEGRGYDSIFSTKSGKSYKKFVKMNLIGENVIYERYIDPSRPDKLIYKKLNANTKGVPFYDATKSYSDIEYNKLQVRGNAKFKISQLEEKKKETNKVGPSSEDTVTDNFSEDTFIPSSANDDNDGKDPMETKTSIDFDDEGDLDEKYSNASFFTEQSTVPFNVGTKDVFINYNDKYANWVSTQSKLEDLDEKDNGLCKR